jgi:hypothetical protein
MLEAAARNGGVTHPHDMVPFRFGRHQRTAIAPADRQLATQLLLVKSATGIDERSVSKTQLHWRATCAPLDH